MQKASPGAPARQAAGGVHPPSERTRRLRAIGLICLAVTCFTGIDATAKYLVAVGGLPVTQVVWVRFAGQFLSVVFVLGAVSVPRLMRTAKPWHQLLRSLLLLASTLFNYMALKELRLDQTTAIQFMAPLIVALMAGPILGEWVGWRRLLAIIVGFLGILLVVRPGFSGFQLAMLYAFGTVICYAVFIILTRYLAAHDPPETTLFLSLLAGTYLVAPLAIVDWVWPADGWMWVPIITVGMWAALGHYIFILAHRWAPAPVIAPFGYVQLLSMTGAGYLLFGDLPDFHTLAGAMVIIASGLYLIYRERQLKGE